MFYLHTWRGNKSCDVSVRFKCGVNFCSKSLLEGRRGKKKKLNNKKEGNQQEKKNFY
jgi:hypothetical protein